MIYFTSDMHFGHQNIIEYCNRPFDSVDEMNEALIDNWNSVVQPTDTVWVLGDVAMGKIAETLPLVSRLNGIKALVCGNHDRCWSGHKKVGDWKQKYKDVGFVEVVTMATIRIPELNTPILMHHFPYKGDSGNEDRYVDQRPKDQGMWLLHGHVHDTWKRNGRMINVGMDVWDYKPVSIDEITSIIGAEKEGRI